MKRILLSLYILTIISVSIWAQPRLTANKEIHKFGQTEWKQPATVEYVITNTGNEPLVLTHITTSCACAVADWTQTPILPDQKGFIKVTFDAKALGHFHKSVGIYSNATPNLVYLYFTGEVVHKITDYSNWHPHTIGQIMIDKVELDFSDVHQGEKKEITLSVVNLSERPYEPVLMHLPSYLEMKKEPNVLLKGERGYMTVTLNTDKLPELGLTQASVYLARFAGDKIGDENEIPISIVLLPDLATMNLEERANAPVIKLSETTVDLHAKLKKRNKVTHTITIYNDGKLPLEISKLQLFDPAIEAHLKKATLMPGEKTNLKITVSKNLLSKKKHPRILLITNDPERPRVVIDLIVE